MPSTAKLSKKMKRKEKVKEILAEILEIKKKFLKLEGYRIEVSKNSFILFENEQDYLNLFYLEKVVFDFINNLLYNKDKDKEIRIYFRLTLIYNYLKSLPKYRKIKIFYDTRYENPFKIKFPFICCFEDLDKRKVYLDEIKVFFRHRNNDGKNENGRQFYEGESLYEKYRKLINLLYKRIDIEHFKRKKNKFEPYNREKSHHRIFIANFRFLSLAFKPESDTESDTD